MSTKTTKKITKKSKAGTKKAKTSKKRSGKSPIPVDVCEPQASEGLNLPNKEDAVSELSISPPTESELALLDKRSFAVKVPYSEKIAGEIVERVFQGERLTKIAETPGMPIISDIYKWLKYHGDFREMYDLARTTEGLRAYEDLLQISEDAKYASKDEIPGLKLSADIKRWIAERTSRKEYAQSVQKDDSGVVINIQTGIVRNEQDERSFEDVVDQIRNVNEVGE